VTCIIYIQYRVSIYFQTSQKFKERLDAKLNNTDTSQIVGYPEAPLAYDAVWALALALNKTSSQ